MIAVTQELLRAKLNARLAAAGHAPLSFQGDEPAPAVRDPVCAYLVIKQLDLATYVRTTLAYVGTLPPETRAAWHRSFTMTVFLAGNPANLVERAPLQQVSPDGALAWTLPRPPSKRDGLARLLQRLSTSRPAALPARAVIEPVDARPGEGRTVFVCVAAAGLRLEEYLIHLNHTLCESCIEGLIDARDRVEITHVAAIEQVPASARYFRVHRDPARAGALGLYAYLVP